MVHELVARTYDAGLGANTPPEKVAALEHADGTTARTDYSSVRFFSFLFFPLLAFSSLSLSISLSPSLTCC